MTLSVLHISTFLLKPRLIIEQVSVRSHVCGITTVESVLPTTGVWSRVLDLASCVYIQRIKMFKKVVETVLMPLFFFKLVKEFHLHFRVHSFWHTQVKRVTCRRVDILAKNMMLTLPFWEKSDSRTICSVFRLLHHGHNRCPLFGILSLCETQECLLRVRKRHPRLPRHRDEQLMGGTAILSKLSLSKTR